MCPQHQLVGFGRCWSDLLPVWPQPESAVSQWQQSTDYLYWMENIQLHLIVASCHFILLSLHSVFMLHLVSDMTEQGKGKWIRKSRHVFGDQPCRSGGGKTALCPPRIRLYALLQWPDTYWSAILWWPLGFGYAVNLLDSTHRHLAFRVCIGQFADSSVCGRSFKNFSKVTLTHKNIGP